MSASALAFTASLADVRMASTSTSKPSSSRARAVKSKSMPSVRCGNAYENGLFAPIVRVARDVIGVKRFNQIRGKAIALHSQVIGEFCDEFGIDSKGKQSLIRTAKANGGKLGFLA